VHEERTLVVRDDAAGEDFLDGNGEHRPLSIHLAGRCGGRGCECDRHGLIPKEVPDLLAERLREHYRPNSRRKRSVVAALLGIGQPPFKS